MSESRIEALDELRDGFRTLAHDRGQSGRFVRRRVMVMAAAGVLVLSAGAGAAGIALREDEPTPEPPVADVAPRLRADPATGRLAAVRVPDPAGGPAWGLRLTSGANGAQCATVGQIVEGRLGVVRDDRFRELPSREAHTCLDAGASRPLTMQRRSFLAPGEEPRTAIFGLASEKVERVELAAPGADQAVRPGADGGYLAVFPGDVNPVRTIVFDDGKRQVLDPRP